MEYLLSWDLLLFGWINQTFAHPLLDSFFLAITNLHREPWLKWGLLPFVIGYSVWRAGARALRVLAVFAIVIGACDFVNHRLIKPSISRPRPFQVAHLKAELRLPVPPGGFSFPSNHAVNLMAATVLIGAYLPPALPWAFLITCLVSYSRPYLGAHFPFDILAGWLLGAAVALAALALLKKWAPRWGPER